MLGWSALLITAVSLVMSIVTGCLLSVDTVGRSGLVIMSGTLALLCVGFVRMSTSSSYSSVSSNTMVWNCPALCLVSSWGSTSRSKSGPSTCCYDLVGIGCCYGSVGLGSCFACIDLVCCWDCEGLSRLGLAIFYAIPALVECFFSGDL